MKEIVLTQELDDLTQAASAFGIRLSDGVDEFEGMISKSFQPVDCDLKHVFTPGLYSRSIMMKAGSLITSKIHVTEHQFLISQGKVAVWTKEQGVVHLEAPYLGITKPGTRRILYVIKDTIWTTFHPTVEGENSEEDLAKIEDRIIEKHNNPYISQS